MEERMSAISVDGVPIRRWEATKTRLPNRVIAGGQTHGWANLKLAKLCELLELLKNVLQKIRN